MPSMTLLNETGDITLSWDDERDQDMRQMIQKKLDEGYAFFIIEPKFFGLLKKRIRLHHINDLKGKEVSLEDNDAMRMMNDSSAKGASMSVSGRNPKSPGRKLSKNELKVINTGDPDAQKAYEGGKVKAGNLPKDGGEMKTTGLTRDADRIAKSDTMAVRPMRGG